MKSASVLLVIIATTIALPIEDAELERVKKSPTFGHLSGDLPQFRGLEHNADDHKRSYYEPAVAVPGVSVAVHGAPGLSGVITSSIGSSYGVPALPAGGIAISGGSAHGLAGIAAPGPAIGLFPNARVGGCNVPLLLSCAPNVVAGVLSEAHGYSAPAYRNNEDELMRDAGWAEHMPAKTHHKVSEDFLESHHGKGHIASIDKSEHVMTMDSVHHKENEHASDHVVKHN
ncbi:unnamed protein product [Diatraea saccharalis]|uniref:Uncharacterized protein n=1 Tax=Diatraea saccharalis TaxID=40085 RepID=A0A9N9QUZ7_9NEOP|nr:unnamed protein product [Diatraea saccharalis]